MEKKDVRSIYNRTAREYEEFVIPCKICQYLMLIHELNLTGEERILELGSGPGYLSIEIAKNLGNGQVLGVDISEKMVEIASSRSKERAVENVKFLIGDVTDLCFKEKVFDISVNSYLIHWLRDPLGFLREVKRVLKDGGKLGIICPSLEWYAEIREAYEKTIRKYREHLEEGVPQELVGIKLYSEEELKELLLQADFHISKFISFKFREAIPLSLCLKRIDAKSGETYFSFLPSDIRDETKENLLRELVNISGELATTESGYIIIAEKRQGS